MFYLGVLPEPLKGFFRKDLSLMNETVANSGCAHVGSVCVLCFLLVYRYYIFLEGVNKVNYRLYCISLHTNCYFLTVVLRY